MLRCRMIGGLLALGLIAVLLGCSEYAHRGERRRAGGRELTLSDLPAPVQATIRRLVGEGEIRKLQREQERGALVYDVEARVQGKDVEYDVGIDGTVLTSEESVEFASLPAAVRAAADKYFGSTEGLRASMEIEQGKTFYEVEGEKDSGKVAVKFAASGAVLEQEEAD